MTATVGLGSRSQLIAAPPGARPLRLSAGPAGANPATEDTTVGTTPSSSTDASTKEAATDVASNAKSLGDEVKDALPRVGIAIVLLIVAYYLAKVVRHAIRVALQRKHDKSFSRVLSRVAGWGVMTLAALIAITITFPSISPGNVLTSLGFVSVAVGFAFQDILENTLAGLLLLFRQPFEIGDEVGVEGGDGTVEAITIRETRIRQHDGQLKIIPNRDVYKNPILVHTDRPERRFDFTIEIDYPDDLDGLEARIVDRLGKVDSIGSDHPIAVVVDSLGESTITLRVKAWCGSDQHTIGQTRSDAMSALRDIVSISNYDDIRLTGGPIEVVNVDADTDTDSDSGTDSDTDTDTSDR